MPRLGAVMRRVRMAVDEDYRRRRLQVDRDKHLQRARRAEIQRLESLPRYQETRTDLLGDTLELVDAESFLTSYRTLFEEDVLRFTASRPDPLIIDGGANVGVSVLYFKTMYPDSRIVAFEPDPRIFAVLERNIAAARCSDVQLEQRALWSCQTELAFQVEGADAGRVARAGEESHALVQTGRLRDYLTDPVEFLKLDIEGAETEVLEDCADRLHMVTNLYVEYHSFEAEPQRLHHVLRVLADADFRVQVRTQSSVHQPYLRRDDYLGMDMVVDVFAYRS